MFVLILACSTEKEDSTDPLAGLTVLSEDPSDNPVAGVYEEWIEQFDKGDTTFEEPLREAQGLGPVYIRAACASCHADDARGPGTVIKMVVPGDAELDAELLPFGHTERPYLGGGAITPLLAPEDSRVLITTRSPPAVFGRGYLDAVEDATILALAEAQSQEGLVSGRPNMVRCDFEANPESLFFPCEPGATVVGRFGLKARVPTLDGFAADAYQGDMAITSPMRPEELPNPDGLLDDAFPGIDIDLETVNVTADYMRLLAIPDREEVAGIELFKNASCDSCHTPTLPTRSDWPVPEMAGLDALVFTDLLLHEMGEGFSDGLEDYDAGSSEWKTSPLIGLRFLTSYLHDGRAQTIEEAILAHGASGSEALFSVELFQKLSSTEQEELILFVESL
jgi:CxxC motif-containing protein (DUF1111 family)